MSVTGYINNTMRLVGAVADNLEIIGSVNSGAQLIGTVQAGSIVVQEPDYYEGSYEVRPAIKSQTLQTKDKTMLEDLQIEAIPYAEVTNQANGVTVTIGV